MAKGENVSASAVIRVTVSRQSADLLEQLARSGLYGRNAAEVAARFIDSTLQGFVDRPRLSITSDQG